MRKARIYDARQLPAYLSPAQYAALMGVNLKTVQKMCRTGRLPAEKVGPRLWRIDKKARRCSEHRRAYGVIVLSHYHQKFNTKQEETQVKLKATIRASLWYMAAMVTAIGALLVSSGIEHSANGWEMLGWAAAALVLLAAALAMLGLGCCADKESRKGNKAHKAPADTVKPKSRRKAG